MIYIVCPFLLSMASSLLSNSLGESTGIYSVTVRAKPFVGDILGYMADFVVVQDGFNTYQVLPLPVPPSGNVIDVGRFNDDNYMDFAYLHYDYQSNSLSTGSLVVVTWTGENFELLSEIPFRHGPCGYDPAMTWQFASFDDDRRQELIQTQWYCDNWDCEFIRVTYYDWQADGTLGVETSQDTFPESFGCLLRQAEEKMWAQHYTEAIEFYNHALAYPVQDETCFPISTCGLAWPICLRSRLKMLRSVFTGIVCS